MNIKAKKKTNSQRFILNNMQVMRFILAGSLNSLLGFFLFPVMYFIFREQQKNYVLILLISQLICMSFSFFSHKVYVFRSHHKVSPELMKFIGFHGIWCLVSIKINPAIVNQFGIHPVIIQTLINVLIVITSYFWYAKINFTPNKLR